MQNKLPLINSKHGSETRNIINELIKLFNGMGYTYDEALQNAHNVLKEAQKTNDMNKNVQQQINTLIAESGTSDSEVVQARIDSEGNEYDALKTRLDEKEQNFNTQLAQTTNDVSSFGAKGNGDADDTVAIQKALDKGGIVTIRKPGNYIVGALYIGSNTTLILGDGVRFVLKSGTSDYMIRNKGAVANPRYRDKNITISGGEFDFNSVDNPQTGAYLDGLFSGHGIVFHGVDGLIIENTVEAGNARKYVFLLADVTNVVCENGYIDNNSDGIHFQPPCNNIVVRNWSGWTNDNYIAFTGGDYRSHTVSEDGSGDNILIENIYLNDPTRYCKEPIRFVGAGKSGLGYFDNIEIKNIVAKSAPDLPIVQLIFSDQSVPNDYLKNTRIKKMKISGLKRLNESSAPLIVNQAYVDNMSISGIEVNPATAPLILFSNWYIRNLKFENIHTLTGVGDVVINKPIIELGVSGTAWIIKNLTIDHCNFEIRGVDNFTLLKSINDAVESLNISNSNVKFLNDLGYLFDLSGIGIQSSIKISNSKITGVKNKIKTNVLMSIDSSEIKFVNNVIANLDSVGKLRLLASSSVFTFAVENLVRPATLSYDGTSAMCNHPLNELTPISGDVFNVIYGHYHGLYRARGSNVDEFTKTEVTL